MTQSARCIYCLQTKQLTEFNTEHVLPRAFGAFDDALTLVAQRGPAVCIACNSYFGQTLDRILTRDSIEAMFRLQAGLKSPKELHDLFAKRVRIRLPGTASWGPLHLELLATPKGDGFKVVPIPQVRFVRKKGGFETITEGELATDDPRSNTDLEVTQVALFWSANDENANARLIKLLEMHGIGFHFEGVIAFPPDLSEIDTEIHWIIDRSVARAVAKIAFNYVAVSSRTADPSLPYCGEFDPIRNYIRGDVGRSSEFVQMARRADAGIEIPEKSESRQHRLATNWSRDVLGYVCLFNFNEYIVRIAPTPQRLWVDIDKAHTYDLDAQRAKAAATGRFIVDIPRGIGLGKRQVRVR